MKRFGIVSALLLALLNAGCGAVSEDPSDGGRTQRIEGGLTGRYESSERIRTTCMDGNEYDLPRMTVTFDSNGFPCVRNGCSDAIGCAAVATLEESLDAIGDGCLLENGGRIIACEGLTLVRQSD